MASREGCSALGQGVEAIVPVEGAARTEAVLIAGGRPGQGASLMADAITTVTKLLVDALEEKSRIQIELIAAKKDYAKQKELLILTMLARDSWKARVSELENSAVTAYAAGWCEASRWADRDDLLADVCSPAYVEARDRALGRVSE